MGTRERLDIVLSVVLFFSSRRRHTRLQGDWSSDVCSSDLCWRARCVFLISQPQCQGVVRGDLGGRGGRGVGAGGGGHRGVPAQGAGQSLQIGRGAWRGRGEILVVGGSFKKKKEKWEECGDG